MYLINNLNLSTFVLIDFYEKQTPTDRKQCFVAKMYLPKVPMLVGVD